MTPFSRVDKTELPKMVKPHSERKWSGKDLGKHYTNRIRDSRVVADCTVTSLSLTVYNLDTINVITFFVSVIPVGLLSKKKKLTPSIKLTPIINVRYNPVVLKK